MFEYSQSKEYLARLLANENINIVRDSSASTAWFNLKDRTMTLPTWKTTEDVYDLLTLHEISHALHTPEAGWHDAITVDDLPKSYLNILEDARIERLITSRYAGANRVMRDGYAKMNEQDIFGLVKHNLVVADLPLIDRINLHYKLGNHLYVPFTDEERVWLDKIDKLKTWEDVVALCKELYASEKTKKEAEAEDKTAKGEVTNPEAEADSNEVESSQYEADSNEEQQLPSDKNFDPLDSVTDEEYRKNFETFEQSIVDNQQRSKYANIGKANSDCYTVPIEKFRGLYSELPYMPRTVNNLLNEHVSVVNNMVKEFEAKKRASSVARQQYAKTGRLDVKKIHKYQLSEDIFRRNLIDSKGKNHGMVMLFDWSGSMQNKLVDTFVQTVLLAMFCRKVKIPFSVQLFISNYSNQKFLPYTISKDCPTNNQNDYFVNKDDVSLVEVLSSRSNEQQFLRDLSNFAYAVSSTLYYSQKSKCDWMDIAEREASRNKVSYNTRDMMTLGSTPLNDALFIIDDYIAKFKKLHNLEITNLVVMTDGASDTNCIAGREVTAMDKITGKVYRTKSWLRNAETNILYDVLRTRHAQSLNIIGYFVSDSREIKSSASNYDPTSSFTSKDGKLSVVTRNDHMMADRFFLIPTTSLDVEDDWEVDEGSSVAVVKNSFKKHMKNKKDTRVFVSRFIDSVAQKL
jgi:hypothetical protein